MSALNFIQIGSASDTQAASICADFLKTNVIANSKTGHYSRTVIPPKAGESTYTLIEEDFVEGKKYARKSIFKEIIAACVVQEVWLQAGTTKTSKPFTRFDVCENMVQHRENLSDLISEKAILLSSLKNLDSENSRVPAQNSDDSYKDGGASAESMASYYQNQVKSERASLQKRLADVETREKKLQSALPKVLKPLDLPQLPDSFQPNDVCELRKVSMKSMVSAQPTTEPSRRDNTDVMTPNVH